MTNAELMKLAEAEGFLAAVIETKDIPVNAEFRRFCEDNLCGKYNANYSCPPACGTVEEVHGRLLAEDQALVLETICEIGSYENKDAILTSKKQLNGAILRLMEQVRQVGFRGFPLGYGGCPLCDPCKQAEGEPCVFPEKRISCMSAYCIDVAKLAKRCDLEFAWIPERLHLFGMIVFHREEQA